MDLEMNRVCYCGVRLKPTTSWTYENPAMTERAKGVIVGLLKKIVAIEQERKNERILEFCFLVMCFWWVKVVVVKGGFGFMLLKVIVVNEGFGV
ncbi:hypothetical protein GQ457_01G030460 [Hibiscus cannabinus]